MHGSTCLQSVGSKDITFFAIGVMQQADAGRAVRIILDGGHFGRHVKLVALEVDQAIAPLVSTTTVAHGDPTQVGPPPGFLERPQLVAGDRTVLEPGMVFAVDGSVSVAGYFRAQVGDSVVVTENGYEPITEFPKTINEVVVG